MALASAAPHSWSASSEAASRSSAASRRCSTRTTSCVRGNWVSENDPPRPQQMGRVLAEQDDRRTMDAAARDDDSAKTIYCKTCGYCLKFLNEHRCPECGLAFDPQDIKTFLAEDTSSGRRQLVT